MKKFILSFGLIFVFTAYVLYSRQGVASTVAVAVNTKNNSTKSTQVLATVVPKIVSTPKPVPTLAPAPAPVVLAVAPKMYNDGTYTGSFADAYYGYVQVQVVISNGQITDVNFLNHPSDRGTSVRINNRAMPILTSEAVSIQSANVNIVSGATATSEAFRASLGSALASAKN